MLVDGSKGTKSARKAMWAEKKKTGYQQLNV
jgi:hypothetical protein